MLGTLFFLFLFWISEKEINFNAKRQPVILETYVTSLKPAPENTRPSLRYQTKGNDKKD